MEYAEHSEADYRRALAMMAEQILLHDGHTNLGVERHLEETVAKYLDMATGRRKPFLGSRFRKEAPHA